MEFDNNKIYCLDKDLLCEIHKHNQEVMDYYKNYGQKVVAISISVEKISDGYNNVVINGQNGEQYFLQIKNEYLNDFYKYMADNYPNIEFKNIKYKVKIRTK